MKRETPCNYTFIPPGPLMQLSYPRTKCVVELLGNVCVCVYLPASAGCVL